MPRTILDVSRWQGRIDWDKVKASGLISGVMIRAMGNSKEGKPSKPYIDPYFASNYAECTRRWAAKRSSSRWLWTSRTSCRRL